MKNKTRLGKLDTYIGEQTLFEGSLTSKDDLCIYGSVRGRIESAGRVVIGQSGEVEADIVADDVVVNGKVVGDVTAKGILEMSSTGIIQGDVKTSRLIMEDGGKFEGHCEMLTGEEPPAGKKAEPEDVAQTRGAEGSPKPPSPSKS